MTLQSLLDYAAPLPPYTPNTVSQLKREFVRNTAVQAVAMTFFTGFFCYYSNNSETRIEFFKKAVVVLGGSTLMRALALNIRYQAIVHRGSHMRVGSLVADCLSPLFTAMQWTHFFTIIQFGGHALFASLFLKSTEKLEIVTGEMQSLAINLGSTSLSELGRLLGDALTLRAFTSAGIVTLVASRTIFLMTALHDMAGELSKFLFFAVSYSLVKEFRTSSAVKTAAIAAISIILTAAFLHHRHKIAKVTRTFLDYASPLPQPSKDISQTLKREFIRNTAIQGLVLTSLVGLSCYLANKNELRMEFLQNAVTGFTVSTVARAFAMLVRYAAIVNQGLPARIASYGADCIAPLFFPLRFHLDKAIVHEGGHFFAMLALMKEASIKIIIESEHWSVEGTSIGLTKLGSMLGEDYSRRVIVAAGPMATSALSTIFFIGSCYFNQRELSKTLFFVASFSLIRECNYAKSALTFNSDNPLYSNHDFVKLWKEGGIHPYAAMIGMVALPLITTLGFLGIRYRL